MTETRKRYGFVDGKLPATDRVVASWRGSFSKHDPPIYRLLTHEMSLYDLVVFLGLRATEDALDRIRKKMDEFARKIKG